MKRQEANERAGGDGGIAVLFHAERPCPPRLITIVRQKRLSHSHPLLNWDMQTFSEVEQEAMKLPEAQRATLASRLLASLPAVLSDDDEGVAEALRRDAEL